MTPEPVDTVLEDDRWAEAGLERLGNRAAAAALAELGLEPARYELCLLGCDDERIAALNADFRGKGRPTNVLSWPSGERAPDRPGEAPAPPEPGPGEPPEELGDIAIAYETCLREARESGIPFGDHVSHLVVHGVLHLLGYDHIDDKDAELMEATETKILGKLGIPDPYNR